MTNLSIRERAATNTATGYYADDRSDPDFFIEGTVQPRGGLNVVTFIVLAVKRAANGMPVRSAVRGAEFFDAMWAHFAAAGTPIDVIQAEWTSAPLSATATFTTNLDAFNAAVLVHPTLEVAALHGTPTGSYARGKGYTAVTVVQALRLTPTGPFDDVIVQFRRP
jgi:hypothetical protein